MPEFKPTRATALVSPDGELLHVFAALKYNPGKEADGYAPCLILPLWRPIEQCPDEWKDGRRVMLHTGTHWVEAEWLITQSMWACAFGTWLPADYPDFIMLPPPAPEVEKGGVR